VAPLALLVGPDVALPGPAPLGTLPRLLAHQRTFLAYLFFPLHSAPNFSLDLWISGYPIQKQPLDRERYDTISTASTVSSSASASEPVPEAPTSSGGTEALYNTPKTSLDDFELLKVIGKGSYGKVTLVRKKESKRLFAMKSLNKSNVKRRNQVEHTKTERRVLGRAKHPFIVHLHYAFQTSQKLYFVLDYCPGGELFFHLSRMEKFEEPMAKFYAAEITLALEHLHELGVVYRDLKPENILFDDKGHVLLADFGLAKEGITDGAEGTNSMCGTPEYLPPEILDRTGHGTAVDWWALGMVLYEMLTGLPPWYTRNRQKLFDRVRNAPLTFPDEVNPDARSLITGLLNRNPVERLGSRSADDVKNHEFFRDIDWKDLYDRKLRPPFNPCDSTTALEETKNFESEFTRMQINSVESGSNMGSSLRTSDASRPSMTFQGFTYNTPNDLTMGAGSAGRS
jgi:serine/threonine protein kinase